ncbi:MAG TPA: TraR/DksA C4-type zinc finger protein [Actinomycetes bacterium]|nr:TraR/DksA C4-type zinc finger protein [Actinomycetes bacterium]
MDPDSARAALDAKAGDLLGELEALSRPEDSAGGISFGKRVGDGTSIAVERLAQVAAYERLEAMLREVRRAQAKLDQGTYGRCDVCGETIPEGRLEARPWATTCLRHS